MNLLGKKVYIKPKIGSWHEGDWGIIYVFDGEHYHIGMFGDKQSLTIFERSEFIVPRPRKYNI